MPKGLDLKIEWCFTTKQKRPERFIFRTIPQEDVANKGFPLFNNFFQD